MCCHVPHLNDSFKESVSGCPLGGNRGPNIVKLPPHYLACNTKYANMNTNADKNIFFLSFLLKLENILIDRSGSSSDQLWGILFLGSNANFLC